jgi:hypothetical protein
MNQIADCVTCSTKKKTLRNTTQYFVAEYHLDTHIVPLIFFASEFNYLGTLSLT